MNAEVLRLDLMPQLQEFCRHYQVRRMAVFGSALREDFRPDSDIDILVSFNPKAKISFMTLVK
jgi:uncharacterized protein